LILAGAACRQKTPEPAAAASPAQSSPVAGPNACALVTKADIAAIAGMTAKQVKQGANDATTSECSFVAEDDMPLDVLIKKVPADFNVNSAINDVKKMLPGVPVREISGLGDVAFFTGNMLHVYRGRSYVLISMLGFPVDPKTDEAARKLASKVLSQI
jgi:hypothetical protein